MQVLYVTEFIIQSRHEDLSAEELVTDTLDLLGRWIDPWTSVSSEELLRDGQRTLEPTHGATAKIASWSSVSAESDWATRVEIRTIDDSGETFVARVTVGEVSDTLGMRISLARELSGSGLIPVQDADVRQPRLLSTLVKHSRLRVSVVGQGVQDGRNLRVRDTAEVRLVADILGEPDRLPVLLVHARTDEAIHAVRRAAEGLVGLARVVTFDLRSARLLEALERRAKVPYAGGLLVWADIQAPPIPIESGIINSRDRDLLRKEIMAQIAPISVLIRGVDTTYRTVQQAAQTARAAAAAERTAAAVESGTGEEIRAALEQERNEALEAERFAIDQWEQAEKRATAVALEAARWKAEAEQRRLASRFMVPTSPSVVELTFGNAPSIEVGDPSSLERLCQHLEQASLGRIHFTPNILTTWKRADRYATPDQMRAALVKLARVAHDLYDGQGRAVGHMDRWIREQFDLKVSLQDDAMPKSFRFFNLDGKRLDRTPHIKVNDGVPHHECGRVYFSFDKDGQRLVVDHVGIKY